MLQKTTLALCLLGWLHAAIAQETVFGANNYIEYQVGTLPIVISVPHGGALNPADIPDRTCNSPVFATDFQTIETALQIKAALFAATGCYPHLIICHLDRPKLDCNRNLADGACGNPAAATAWQEFHNFISAAQDAANQQYNNQTVFIDLHGHGNPIQRIELGYLLYDDELELPDNTLNSAQYVGYSSIQNLVANNANNYTHAELLKGPKALGTLLGNQGFPAVPSQQIPSPGTTSNYYSGGYITANHTCYADGEVTNGMQMELNFTGVRDNAANRTLFAQRLTVVLLDYLNTHFQITWSSCAPVSTTEVTATPATIAPNPQQAGGPLTITGLPAGNWQYTLVNSLGLTVSSGSLTNPEAATLTAPGAAGCYLLVLSNPENGARQVLQWMVL